MNDKTKYKNWIDGDTFAIKIENISPEYDGQYLILIKNDRLDIKDWNKNRTASHPIFYAKITTNYTMPKSQEEIEKLEFIKLVRYSWENRYLPYSGLETYEELKERKKHIKFYPDEFMYLYCYATKISMGKKYKDALSKFNYIGNFNISLPKDEYIPGILQTYLLKNGIIAPFIEDYEMYNKRKGNCYTKEGIEAIKEQEKRTIQFRKYEEQFIKKYRQNKDNIKSNKDVDKLLKEVMNSNDEM